MPKKLGKDLVVGDVIDLWYNHKARIFKIEKPDPNKKDFVAMLFGQDVVYVTTTAKTESDKMTITIPLDDEFTIVENI